MFIVLAGILACILFYFAYNCICNAMENIIGVLCILVGIACLAFGFKAQQDVHQSKKDIATEKQTEKEQEAELHKLITSDKVKIVVDDEAVSD